MEALKRILVPTDFSEGCTLALTKAIELADRAGAVVEVLHVVEMPAYLGAGPAAIPYGPLWMDLEKAGHEQAEKKMAAMLEKVSASKPEGVQIETKIVSGDPRAVVTDTIEADKPDLAVVATHGRTGLSRLLLGSVAERIVRLATCPVLTIRTPSKAA